MEPFSAAFLKTLGGEFAKGTFSRLKQQVGGTPVQKALEHCLQVGLVALVAQATAAEPEQEAELASLFDRFFHDPDVWTEIARLVQDKPLDHERLLESFVEAGFDADTLPNLDFKRAVDAFAAAYVNAAEWQPELQGVVQTARSRQLLGEQRELLAQMKELVAAIREQTAVNVRAGNVVEEGSGRTIWNVGKYVAADEVHGTKIVMPGDFRGATIHIVSQYMQADGAPTLSEERFRTALRKYLVWVTKHYGQLHLRGIERREQTTLSLTLDDVYLSLAASIAPDRDERRNPARKADKGRRSFLDRLVGRAQDKPDLDLTALPAFEADLVPVGDDEGLRTVDMAELLALGDHLVIIGGPGSGKTTYLYLVASAIARALLSGDATGPEVKLGLTGPLPLPIYVSLGEYNRYRRKADDPGDPNKGTLTAFISYALIRQHAILGVPRDFFERLLLNGQSCLLLLDGLDEIADEEERGKVRQDIQNLADNPDSGRILVTSRTRAYQGRAILPETFRHAMVQPMSPEQVNALVERWCSAVYVDELDASAQTQRLQKEIVDLEALRAERGEERLADTPLMVTIIAIVHYNDRHLPEQRAALYDRCVDVLLAEPYKPETDAAVEFSKWGGTTADKRYFLSHLAFEMMSAGAKAGRVVEEAQLERWMRPLFVRRMGEERAEKELRDFCAAMKERGALLDERDRTYQFVHLTFQEFLCAAFLAENRREVGQITAFFVEDGRLTESWWRETILLTVGYLGLRPTDASLELARRLAQLPGVDEAALAAAELAGRAFLELEARDDDTNAILADRLVALLTDENLIVPNPFRAAAGLTLGRLGDPRADVSCDTPAMVRIPAGPFRMGSERRRGQPGYDDLARESEATKKGSWHEVTLPAYRIGKYPVTVAQYRRFVEADGYDLEKSKDYWQGSGLKWLKESGQKAPRYWDDPQWHVDNHPVIGVTWYEAVAYCAWLTATEGRKFRLPDEAMWEKAARGADGRRWPWGNEFDKEKLNSSSGGIGRTSAVGIFPAGKSPFDVYDCAGNVWEWCSGPGVGDTPYPFKQRSYEEDLKLTPTFRALRGGSWGDDDRDTRAAYRNDYYPDYRYLNVGFRVAELLSDPDF